MCYTFLALWVFVFIVCVVGFLHVSEPVFNSFMIFTRWILCFEDTAWVGNWPDFVFKFLAFDFWFLVVCAISFILSSALWIGGVSLESGRGESISDYYMFGSARYLTQTP